MNLPMNAPDQKQSALAAAGQEESCLREEVGLSIGIAFDTGEGFAVRLDEAKDKGAAMAGPAPKIESAMRKRCEEGAG